MSTPRPAPPNEHTASKILHPLYQSLDLYNYSKALKLTSSSGTTTTTSNNANSPHCQWDIVKALRVHALERSGKRREALLLLWSLLVMGQQNNNGDNNSHDQSKKWAELYERIQSMTDAVDVVNDATSSSANDLNGSFQLMDAVQRLDARAFACLDQPMAMALAFSAPSTVTSTANSTAGNGNAKSSSKVSKSSSKTSSKSSSKSNNNKASPVSSINYPPITDETVLTTLAVTLRIEGLYDTMSEMYFQATEQLAFSSSTSSASVEEANNFRNVLEEAVCIHFQAVCDCTSFRKKINGTDKADKADEDGINKKSHEQLRAELPNLQTLLRLTTYYERMQTSCLQLAKLSGESLHFQWTAIVSLWYKDSLVDLVDLLEGLGMEHSSTTGDKLLLIQKQVSTMLQISSIDEMTLLIQKMKQKIMLLPRLAESLSLRMVNHKKEQQQSGGYPPSENDWDVYLETLIHQQKMEEALLVLKDIPSSPMGTSGSGNDSNNNTSNNSVVPQIHDEHTIETHVGSILPYTQRKKLERLANVAFELGNQHDQVEGWYRELLTAFPDQWSYWLGLVDSAVLSGSRRKENNDMATTATTINDDGWKRCHSFAQDIIASEEKKNHAAVRGPYLILVELAALHVRDLNNATTTGESKGQYVELLRQEICNYGNKFGPLASCCFADIRPYLGDLVQATSASCDYEGVDSIPHDVSLLLQLAKDTWTGNSQCGKDSSTSLSEGEVSSEEFRQRRKKLRAYTFAVQEVYGVVAELEKLHKKNSTAGDSSTFSSRTCKLLETYSPSISQLVTEWRTSLTFLPGVAPKDGGQKEVLPGDEIILLATQQLQFQASYESPVNPAPHLLLAAAALLEKAMDHSPYNPHLKIAAIGVYSQLQAANRALSIFNDLGVKQIQLDSCSYLILPLLLRGGLYTSAIELSSSILRLHGSTSKDVKDYASKAFKNGYLLKAKEMITFQRERMRPSLQLLHSKGLVMDCAALMNVADLSGSSSTKKTKDKTPAVKLGDARGLCGGEEDMTRAEQLVVDAEVHFNAPSIIHSTASASSLEEFISSDNRDITVNYFEILYKNQHLTQKEMATESLMRGHMHGILIRAVMASGVAKAPKKGKVPKSSEEMTNRCHSLLEALERSAQFIAEGVDGMGDIDQKLWESSCALCQVIIIVIVGTPQDTLAEREKAAVSLVEAATESVKNAQSAFESRSVVDHNDINVLSGAMVCQLLPDRIVSLYTLVETTATLFALFGWGKRKRLTKPASGALANLALSFRNLLSGMMQTLSRFRAFGDESESTKMDALVQGALGAIYKQPSGIETNDVDEQDSIRRAIREVVTSRNMTTDRVDPFLVQMWESLDTFDEKD